MKKDSAGVVLISFLLFILAIMLLLSTISSYFYGEKFPNDNSSGDTSGEIIWNFSGDYYNSGDETESGEAVEELYTGPKIFSGDSRSVAIMIDNDNRSAWPHAGLNNAYMIYEFIIEGGSSRFIAFFKEDNLPDKVGPIRSSRHYFLDYVMEHDAIYCHFGWSPLAQSDIPRLGINNINGIYDTYYWREPPKSSYHNAFSSKELIEKYIEKKHYRTTQKQDCIISFNEKDTDLPSGDSMNATNITCKYSGSHYSSYEYDPETKTYLRSMRGEPHVDRFTNERFYAKNILAYQIEDKLLDDPEDKGRRELYNIGTGTGYYFTNGKAIKINWSKKSRASETKYTDMEGNELKFNDGITWVEIVPASYGSIKFE